MALGGSAGRVLLEWASMNFIDQLRQAEAQNQSMLCVGLDPEPARFPAGVARDAEGIHQFCARIVEATADLVCAFKPQIAYFAAHRAEPQLERLIAHMRAVSVQHAPSSFLPRLERCERPSALKSSWATS